MEIVVDRRGDILGCKRCEVRLKGGVKPPDKFVTTWDDSAYHFANVSYLFDGATYKMDNEHYNVSFVGDTAVLSVNGDEQFRLEPLK